MQECSPQARLPGEPFGGFPFSRSEPNGDSAGSLLALFLSAFGFFFSRLLLFCPFAIVSSMIATLLTSCTTSGGAEACNPLCLHQTPRAEPILNIEWLETLAGRHAVISGCFGRLSAMLQYGCWQHRWLGTR
jgi:hypothetical protein